MQSLDDLKQSLNGAQTFRVSPFQWPDFKSLCRCFANSFTGKAADRAATLGLFPLRTSCGFKFSDKIALCLGSYQEQNTGSGPDWSSGTFGRLQGLLLQKEPETLHEIYAWRKAGWNGREYEKPEGAPDHWSQVKGHIQSFLETDGVTFCVVAVLDAQAARQ